MDLAISSDENLMLRYAEGDAIAFETLYTRHKAPVYRYMLRLCRNESIAEEIFQEVWFKIINARNDYVKSAKFTTYLYKIAHNCFIDHYRKQNIRIVPVNSDDAIDIAVDSNNPEQEIEMNQTLNQFNTLIEDLPVEQREIFLLKEETNMSLQEIAQMIGINHETAKSRLRYAIKHLKAIMNEL